MSVQFRNGLDLNNKNLTALADGVNPTDAVTLQQLLNYIAGMSWKVGVKAASVSSGTLATAFVNGGTLDGVALVTGDRILLKDQATASENGIRIVGAGVPARATDADSTAELENATVLVSLGTINGEKAFTQTATVTTVNTTAQVWAAAFAGVSYTVGTNGGLTISSAAFSIQLDTASALLLGAGGIKVDRSVVVTKFSANCVVTTNPQTFNHGLNNSDPMVFIKEVSTGKYVYTDVTVVDANNISVDFGGAPAANQFRVVVQA